MRYRNKNEIAIWLSTDIIERIEAAIAGKHVSPSNWIYETIERAIIERIKSENAAEQCKYLY